MNGGIITSIDGLNLEELLLKICGGNTEPC